MCLRCPLLLTAACCPAGSKEHHSVRAHRSFGVTNHSKQVFQTVVGGGEDQELCSSAEDGDRIGILIVSAPYGGYECRGYEAAIKQGSEPPALSRS